VRELLKKYQFPGDEVPVIRGSPSGEREAGGSEGETRRSSSSMTRWIIIFDAAAAGGQAVLMPIEDIFSITGAGRW